MVAGQRARRRPPRPRRRRPAAGRGRAGWSSPGCACAARRPSAAPAPRGRGRRSARCARAARASSGPARSRRKRARSTASSSPTPNHSVRPGPSLSVENARTPERLVLHDPDRHRRRADAGHRPDVAVLVAAIAAGPRRRPAAPRPPSRSAAQPSSRHAATSARRCGSHTRSHAIGGPACSSIAVARARRSTSPAGATVTACGRAPSSALSAAAFACLDALAVRAPRALEQRDDLRVAAARRAPVDVDDVGPLVAHGVGEGCQPDVDGAHALQHAGARVMPDLAHPRRRRPRRARPAGQARPAPARAPAGFARSTATTRPLVAHGDGQLVLVRRGDRPRAARGRPVRRRRGGGRDQRRRRPRHGRAAARARRHARQPRPRRTPSACSTGSRGRPQPARRARGRRPPHARRAPGAVGLLHRHRDARRCARRPRAPATCCSPPSACEGVFRGRRTRRSSARCATATRAQLREDGEALVEVAEAGLCHAARDVSMPGVAGLAAPAARARRLRRDARRRPPPAPRRASRSSAGSLTFPSFGFVLAAAPEHVDRRRATPSPGAAWPARRAAPSTTRASLRLAGGGDVGGGVGPRGGAGQPLTRAGLSAIAMGWCGRPWKATAAPSRCQPSDSEEGHVGHLDHRHHPRAAARRPPWRRRSARAGAPSAPWRASGSTASRSPFQSPAAQAGRAAPRPRCDRPRCRSRAAVVILASRSSRSSPANMLLLVDEDRAAHGEVRRALGGVAAAQPHADVGPRRRGGPRAHASAPSRTRAPTPTAPSRPGSARSRRPRRRDRSPASASIADTDAVDRRRRSRAPAARASAMSVPGTGRSGTTNG